MRGNVNESGMTGEGGIEGKSESDGSVVECGSCMGGGTSSPPAGSAPWLERARASDMVMDDVPAGADGDGAIGTSGKRKLALLAGDSRAAAGLTSSSRSGGSCSSSNSSSAPPDSASDTSSLSSSSSESSLMASRMFSKIWTVGCEVMMGRARLRVT